MSAADLVRDGKLDEALAALTDEVRASPADAPKRVFLFQLLTVLGQWQRALKQLDVAGQLDRAALPMVQTYRDAIACEMLRAEVFAGTRAPLVFGDPEEWIALLLQSLSEAAAQRFEEAAALRERALEDAKAVAGTIDGHAFEWIADADSRLGPVLEAVINGRYYWVPFARIRRIAFDGPEDLRDVVWTPAYFTWTNGGETVGLIPTRYAGSEHSDDDRIRLARLTDWQEHPGELFTGLGQRLLVTDHGDYPLMDVREIALQPGTPDAQ